MMDLLEGVFRLAFAARVLHSSVGAAGSALSSLTSEKRKGAEKAGTPHPPERQAAGPGRTAYGAVRDIRHSAD